MTRAHKPHVPLPKNDHCGKRDTLQSRRQAAALHHDSAVTTKLSANRAKIADRAAATHPPHLSLAPRRGRRQSRILDTRRLTKSKAKEKKAKKKQGKKNP